MSSKQGQLSQSRRRFVAFWRTLRASYRLANVASHHIIGFCIKTLAFVYFVLILLFLSLRYAILPHIDVYKHEIEQLSSRSLGRPVSIARVYASWEGLRPNLFLGDVVIRDKDGRSALTLPSVSATISWWSLVRASLRFDSLEIGRPDLDIRRDVAGKLYIAGLSIDTSKPGDGSGLDWLLNQREIVIRAGRLHWTDEMRGTPELTLDGVTLLIQNQWRHHRAALRATPPTELATPLDVRVDFQHPPFSNHIADFRRWKGELFLEVQGTDLALWKKYVNYPIDVMRGQGSVRAWMSFDQAKLADLTADLSLRDTQVRLQADLPVLELERVHGRIFAREHFDALMADGKPTFGAKGHMIQLRDFSLQTRDGLLLATKLIEEKFSPATAQGAETTEVTVSDLDLKTLAGLAERLPLAAGSRQWLFDFAPQGRLKDFSARWQGAYPRLQAYQVRGQFEGLGLQAQVAHTSIGKNGKEVTLPAIPGFENLTGKIDANESGGKLLLASDGLKLELPGYMGDPVLVFPAMNLDMNWRMLEAARLSFDIKKMAFEFDGMQVNIAGTHTMPLKPQQSLGATDITASLSGLDVTRMDHYLPLKTYPPLRRWLTGALEMGKLDDVQLKLKGDLRYFPFRAEGGHDKKGEFRVTGQISQGRLNYLPGVLGKDGKSPLWPVLEAIQGKIVFERSRMEIFADSAKTHGANLTRVSAIIPDLLSKDAVLDINGTATGNLEDMLQYVNASPVVDWIGNFTEEAHATGPAKLALKFSLPLARALDTKLQGSLQLGGNDIVLQALVPGFNQTQGRLDFSERGLTLNGINAQFAGGPIVLSGGATRDGGVQLRAVGQVSSEGLQRTWPQASMQRFAEHIQGSSRFGAILNIKKRGFDFQIESNLQGVALNFPQPIKKAANETWPMRLQIAGGAADDIAGWRDEVKISLGPSIRAHYWRQKVKNTPWRVVRGGIGVNQPVPEPDTGLQMNLSMRTLSVDAWRNLAGYIEGNSVGKGTVGSVGTVAATDAAEVGGVGQYIDADRMSAQANELSVLGKKLENVVVGALRQKNNWQANIDSNQVSGHITWDHFGVGLGKVTARLAQLVVPESVAADVRDILEGKSEATTIPALDVVADNFELLNKKFGRLELQADNVRAAQGREWQIKQLSLQNPDAELKASGKWITKEGENTTQMNYMLTIHDAGKLLERLGNPNVLRAGKGKMEGDITWKGLPFELDIPSLSGKLSMNVGSGQFLKVEPGAAKLLGVLSLQALPRLLKLDFHDVFSEGFAFDSITAQAIIKQGVLSTDSLKMRGVSATVLMEGNVDIARETQSLRVVVIPDFNVGTASVVYALAVNPVIGLGTFLAQLFLKNPVMKVLTFQYQVAGTWKDPTVTKLEGKLPTVPVEAAPQN